MFTSLWNRYHELAAEFYSTADPRSSEYPLMNSWWPTLGLCLLYIYLIGLGKRWMKDRKPFEIRPLMVFYNVAMVILSIWLVASMLFNGWLTDEYSLGCVPVNRSRSAKPMALVFCGWLFYITKLIEMTDTAFFVLRKKFHLITFLHVFHHASMPASVWFGIKFVPGGFGSFYPLVNTIVHVIMYTYYGLAAAGPQYEKYLWWKKYLTLVQMTQFLILILHNAQMFFIECDYPKIFSYAIFTYACIFFVLFSNYYIQSYRQPRSHPGSKVKLNSTEANGVVGGTQHHTENGVSNGGYYGNGVHKRK